MGQENDRATRTNTNNGNVNNRNFTTIFNKQSTIRLKRKIDKTAEEEEEETNDQEMNEELGMEDERTRFKRQVT